MRKQAEQKGGEVFFLITLFKEREGLVKDIESSDASSRYDYELLDASSLVRIWGASNESDGTVSIIKS